MDASSLWYGRNPLSLLLLPLSWIYCALMRWRRFAYRAGWFHSRRLPVPVIVVGNISVGGTGKTPLVLRLSQLLREHGWTPGILTRGYGGKATDWPQEVRSDSDPDLIGDEPLLLARRSGCLVVAGPDRVKAGQLAIARGGCDILLTDDGLQHYRLQRDLELALIDGDRRFGNGRCLPAGPLREPRSRLKSVDLIVCKNGSPAELNMRLVPGVAVNLRQPGFTRPLADFRGQRVCAVAGIGNPVRFFRLLADAGLDIEARPYPDHHRFTAADAALWPDGPVIMTEKDAVKCASFAGDRHWYLPVDALLDDALTDRFLSKLAGLKHG